MDINRAAKRRPPRPVQRRWLLVVLFAVLALFVVLLARWLSLGQFFSGLGHTAGQVLHGPLPDIVWEERFLEPAPGELSFWAGGDARFAHGYAKGSLRFENSPASPYALVFELTAELDGVSTPIYRSPSLPPGSSLDGDKLRRPLKKGRYLAVCVAYAYAPGHTTPCARSSEQYIELDILG